METAYTYYNSKYFRVTSKGTKISTMSQLKAIGNIQIEGKSVLSHHVIVRADLAKVVVGLYVTCKDNVVLRPAYKREKGVTYESMTIGDNVVIDKNTVV